jgi:hypothetical protein
MPLLGLPSASSTSGGSGRGAWAATGISASQETATAATAAPTLFHPVPPFKGVQGVKSHFEE